jgi:hypothetical protein
VAIRNYENVMFYDLHGTPCAVCCRPAARHYPLLGVTTHMNPMWVEPCSTKPAQVPLNNGGREAA